MECCYWYKAVGNGNIFIVFQKLLHLQDNLFHTFLVLVFLHIWEDILQKQQVLGQIIFFYHPQDIPDCLKQFFIIADVCSMHQTNFLQRIEQSMAARNISGSDAHFVNSNRCIAQKRQEIEIILTKLFVCIKKG